MTQPSVNITQIDNAIGVLPASAGKLYAVLGVSSSGTADTPATYARVRDLTTDFGTGPLVEAAARAMQKSGKPVVVTRAAAASTVGAYGTPVDGVSGTSAVTVDTAVEPYDDYDFIFEVIAGGTIGVAGITYRYSLDGGNNYSATTALGTAVSLTITDGNIGLDFAAGTLVAGDLFSFRTTAPLFDGTELSAALTALGNSATNWDVLYVVGDMTAALAGTLETWMQGMHTAGKFRRYVINTRLPSTGESEATYLSTLTTAWASFSTLIGVVCAGACDMVSSVTGRNYRRPVAHAVAAELAAVSEEIDLASLNNGPLSGVAIRDSAGNNKHHDESINPGLDDVGFCVLRTWDGERGVYVNNPNIFSSTTSDFQYAQHRAVMNLGLTTINAYLRRRLSEPLRVNPSTGFILESEARSIEKAAEALVGAVLLAKPKASSVQVVVSRTDVILSTETLTGDLRIVPLAYPKTITLTAGFSNPALNVATA